MYANAGWQMSEAVSTRFYATYIDNDEAAAARADAGAVRGRSGSGQRAARITGDNRQETSRRRASRSRRPGTSTRTARCSSACRTKISRCITRSSTDHRGSRRPGPAAPVEFFSLLIDTDHRDFGGTLRYNLQRRRHDLLAGINYGDGTVEGGNYRNLSGRANGLTERVDNNADSLEAFRGGSLAARTLLDPGLRRAARRSQPRRAHHRRRQRRRAQSAGRLFVSEPARGRDLRARATAPSSSPTSAACIEAPTTFELEDDVRGDNVNARCRCTAPSTRSARAATAT